MSKKAPAQTVRVSYGPGRWARFGDAADGFAFARAQSLAWPESWVEVHHASGIVGQFRDGKASPEFAHLDQAQAAA